MAGGCGRTYRVDPRRDPAACNAIEETAAGLLVPRTTVEGIAPGTAVGDARSVDIDVQAPAAGACPETWTVGARLTPVFGRVDSVGDLDLLATANGAYLPVPGAEVQLTEPGTYEVTYAAAGEVNLQGQSGQGARIFARLFNVTAGAAVPRTDGLVTGISNTDAAATGMISSAGFGTATRAAFIAVTGPTTLRLEGARVTGNGTPTSYTGIFGNWTDLWFRKVAD